MTLAEALRREVLAKMFALKKFPDLWPARRSLFLDALGPEPSQSDIVALGDVLSEAFVLAGDERRDQGGVSAAGSAWEALVVWYFNLCLLGTSAVCVRGKSQTPKPIRDALSVVFQGNILRDEPDVVILSSPPLAKEWDGGGKLLNAVSREIEASFRETAVVNVQCKTNWNDNSQIIMLWNALYTQASAGALMSGGITIGTEQKSLNALKFFAYSFATVPTNKKNGYKSRHAAVLRVKSISGGNYWGRPGEPEVSASLRSFFNNVFAKHASAFPPLADVGRAAAERCAASGWGDDLLLPFRLN